MERGWRSGPRLPTVEPTDPDGCWRCTETRRVLRTYGLVAAGKLVGSLRLCGPCAGSVTPLNADPLDVTEAA